MAEIISLQPDTYRPYRHHTDDDVSILADARMLAELETWARNRRQVTEHAFKPLLPEVRAKAMQMLAIAKDQPRNE